MMGCVKRCINSFETGLKKEEKICLSKCTDRSYDFLVLGRNLIHPGQLGHNLMIDHCSDLK